MRFRGGEGCNVGLADKETEGRLVAVLEVEIMARDSESSSAANCFSSSLSCSAEHVLVGRVLALRSAMYRSRSRAKRASSFRRSSYQRSY